MNHWLRVELDESTGTVTAKAFCSAPYGPEGRQRDCTVTKDVEVPEAMRIALANALRGLVDGVRRSIERDLRRARAASELAAEVRNEFEDDAGESGGAA